MLYYGEDSWSRALLIYDSALKEINTKIEILNNEFKLKHQYNPIEHVSSRLKSPDSISKKLQRKGRATTIENVLQFVNDVAGIRVICSFTSDIYKIAKLIARQSDVEVVKVKDYISAPKPNGYMSYHMIVTIPIFLSNKMVKTKVEIQIRTIAMDFWASLEHKMYYKFEGNGPEHIRRELKECAEIVNYLDKKMLSINEEIQTYKDEQDCWKDNPKINNDGIYEAQFEEVYEVAAEEDDANEDLEGEPYEDSENKSPEKSEQSFAKKNLSQIKNILKKKNVN